MFSRLNPVNPVIGQNREKGAMAIMMVVLVSMVIVTTLSTIYIYIVNRAKYHSRIKEAYQMTHVMEQFGKILAQAYDTAEIVGAGPCPGGVNMVTTGGMNLCFPANGTAEGNRCVTHNGRSYCLTESLSVASLDNKGFPDFAVIDQEKLNSPSYFSTWYARLDRFFESTVADHAVGFSNKAGLMLEARLAPSFTGWLMREAYAYTKEGEQTYPSPGGTYQYPTNPYPTGDGDQTTPTEQIGIVTDGGHEIGDNTIGDIGVICDTSRSLETCNSNSPGDVTLPGEDEDFREAGLEIPESCSPQDPHAATNLSCLRFCDGDKSQRPEICNSLPSSQIALPNCQVTPGDSRCQACNSTGENSCARISYCLSGAGGCQTGEQPFRQFVRIIR